MNGAATAIANGGACAVPSGSVHASRRDLADLADHTGAEVLSDSPQASNVQERNARVAHRLTIVGDPDGIA